MLLEKERAGLVVGCIETVALWRRWETLGAGIERLLKARKHEHDTPFLHSWIAEMV